MEMMSASLVVSTVFSEEKIIVQGRNNAGFR